VHVLVVEDDALLAEGLMSALTRAGHAVDRTPSGKSADALLRRKEYDLVVLDVGLPDIDGFEVCAGSASAGPRPASWCSPPATLSRTACTVSTSAPTIT